jgi:hypothetical protein
MSNKIKKGFDCVEFKHQVQAERYEKTRHMSTEEWRLYIQESIENGPLADFWRRLQEEAKVAPKTGKIQRK